MKWACATALMLCCACLPRWFVESPVAQKAAQPSAERGRNLLLNKSYLKVGVPFGTEDALYHPQLEPTDSPRKLDGRTRANAFLPTGYTGRMLGPGDDVPAATENCLLCHAGALRGEVVLGLGNSFVDAQLPQALELVDQDRLARLKPSPDARDVLAAWEKYEVMLLPYSRATTPGTIAALYFTGFMFSHRDAQTLKWVEQPLYPMLETPPPETDVPAWWLLKKKRCLYYGCELRGEFTRSLMQFMSVPGNTGADIRAAESDFDDVLAFLLTLEPPKFPGPVDAALAAKGEVAFNERCSKCHGHYGASPSYPNEVVPLERVGTDPARNAFMHALGFAEHYAQSWYGEKSTMAATNGYLAPPLDGIWATAPYFHNASVPTLDAVLDPSLRPGRFIRSRDSRDYDLDRIGWKYEVPSGAHTRAEFDTSGYGKSNAGHRFGEKLSAEERRAVLEYLKTL